MIPFQLHRRIPLIRRPFYQRDKAREEVVRLTRELEQVRSSDRLKAMPWYSIDLPAPLVDGRGMIFEDERRLLYTLTRDFYRGEGRIIDGGTYVGDSSLALGYGLKERNYPRTPIIDAFDLFIIDDLAVRRYWRASDAPDVSIKGGDSIRFLYDQRTASVADYIRVHEGDVTLTPWAGEPIEILFSDIDKGWHINDYILLSWFPSLIPGRSVLIQQDQVQEYHVWVAITMEMLAGHFEWIDYVKFSSAVYRPVRAISTSDVQCCLSGNISPDDMERAYLSWIERFRRQGAGRYTGWHLGMVEAGLIITYGLHVKDLDKAKHAWKVCWKRFENVPDTVSRLNEIRQVIGLEV